ncbi:MAG: LptF/LptG family permease [Armatimonadota bacterium]
MRILDRHILTELIGPFFFGVAAFTSLMFAGRELFKLTQLLAEYGASPFLLLKLMFLHLPSLIVLTLPMAMLLCSLLGFGRLSGDSEIIALFASGISMYRIAVPVLVMAVLVTGLSFVLNEIVVPETNTLHEQTVRKFTKEPVTETKPVLVLDASNGVTNSVIYIQGGFNPETRTMRDVAVIQYLNNKPALFIYGKEAHWKGGNEWTFKDGYTKNIGLSELGGHSVTMVFHDSRTVKINKTPDQISLFQKKYDQLSFSQLKKFIQMLKAEGQNVNEFRVRLYQKISIPLTCLVFALIGTPLGLRPHRSSSAMGLGLAIVIILAYWLLMDYMSVLGSNGTIEPAAASFIPTLVGMAAGIGLIARASK